VWSRTVTTGDQALVTPPAVCRARTGSPATRGTGNASVAPLGIGKPAAAPARTIAPLISTSSSASGTKPRTVTAVAHWYSGSAMIGGDSSLRLS